MIASPSLIRPPGLRPGDTLGVVSPSYAPRASSLANGVRALERAGYNVVLAPEVTAHRRFTRAEDERRAAIFTELWTDPRVDGVIASTGGYGAVRIIPYLDPAVFRAHPKPFVGYSDITALHSWFMRCCGLRTFHGPTVDDLNPDADPETVAALLAAITNPRPDAQLGRGTAKPVRQGRAVGPLVGGNLSLVEQTIGTPYEIDTRGAILFLEETRDPMSYVDERLVHLRNAGLLRGVRGVVLGQLSLDRSEEDEFEDFLLDLVSDLDVPVITDFPAGHEMPNIALPFGTPVELVAAGDAAWLNYADDALAPHGRAAVAAPERPFAHQRLPDAGELAGDMARDMAGFRN